MVEIMFCFHQILVVLSMSWIVQFTVKCSLCVDFILKIDADTVVFFVTKEFTGIHIPHLDISYCVIHQTFISKEKESWERQFTTWTWKSQNLLSNKGQKRLMSKRKKNKQTNNNNNHSAGRRKALRNSCEVFCLRLWHCFQRKLKCRTIICGVLSHSCAHCRYENI